MDIIQRTIDVPTMKKIFFVSPSMEIEDHPPQKCKLHENGTLIFSVSTAKIQMSLSAHSDMNAENKKLSCGSFLQNLDPHKNSLVVASTNGALSSD